MDQAVCRIDGLGLQRPRHLAELLQMLAVLGFGDRCTGRSGMHARGGPYLFSRDNAQYLSSTSVARFALRVRQGLPFDVICD